MSDCRANSERTRPAVFFSLRARSLAAFSTSSSMSKVVLMAHQMLVHHPSSVNLSFNQAITAELRGVRTFQEPWCVSTCHVNGPLLVVVRHSNNDVTPLVPAVDVAMGIRHFIEGIAPIDDRGEPSHLGELGK